MSYKQIDNQSLASKVAIRRWLLGELGWSTVRVLDTCAGAGHIWRAMAAHVAIDRWIRCDVEPRDRGTLPLTAIEAVEKFPLDQFNVIDIDPYGEPWAIYRRLLPRIAQRTAVFVTRGHATFHSAASMSHETLQACGIPPAWPIPKVASLVAFLDSLVLSETWRTVAIEHAAAIEFPHVTYYALALIPHEKSPL